MKILHVNSYYSTSKFYKNFFDKQIELNNNIDVFVPVTRTFSGNNFNFGDYTTVSNNHGRYDRYIFHLKQSKIYKDILREFKINEYNLIHAHSLFTNGYIAYKLNKDYGIPYIVAVRDTDINIFFKKRILLRQTGIEILKRAKQIILLSDTYKDYMINKYIPYKIRNEIKSKIKIIPNGIDHFWLENIPYDRNKKLIDEKSTIKVLQVGEVSKRKNQFTTIKAVNLLKEEGYKVEFTIVGKVRDNKIFREIKKQSGIHHVEHVTKEKLINIFRDHDIFVMPSVTETFGLVYAEAMSQSLPIIYTRGQGFDGQFKNGEVGYSVDCFDEYEIKNNIIKIIDNYKDISLRNIKLCEKFDWNQITRQYNRVYIE